MFPVGSRERGRGGAEVREAEARASQCTLAARACGRGPRGAHSGSGCAPPASDWGTGAKPWVWGTSAGQGTGRHPPRLALPQPCHARGQAMHLSPPLGEGSTRLRTYSFCVSPGFQSALGVGLVSCSGVAVFPQARLPGPCTPAGTALCLLVSAAQTGTDGYTETQHRESRSLPAPPQTSAGLHVGCFKCQVETSSGRGTGRTQCPEDAGPAPLCIPERPLCPRQVVPCPPTPCTCVSFEGGRCLPLGWSRGLQTPHDLIVCAWLRRGPQIWPGLGDTGLGVWGSGPRLVRGSACCQSWPWGP